MRIRTIKPEFWTHPVMGKLPADTRLIAIGLLNMADDEGYFYAEARLVRSSVAPFRDNLSEIEADMRSLAESEWIETAMHPVHGLIGRIINWAEHQRIDRPRESRIKQYWSDEAVAAPAPAEPVPTVPSPQTKERPPKPDDAPARDILDHLNTMAGRQFRPTDQNISAIMARLREVGNDIEGIKMMIDRQCANWLGDQKMQEFLRPDTLFNRTKFQGYYDDRNRAPTTPARVRNTESGAAGRNDGLAGLEQWTRERQDRIAATDASAPPPRD